MPGSVFRPLRPYRPTPPPGLRPRTPAAVGSFAAGVWGPVAQFPAPPAGR